MPRPVAPKRFFGKYRGTVVENVDPELRGRTMCSVPDVLGSEKSGWCETCAPLAGPPGSRMGVRLVPAIGTAVWVEFEQGDPDKPIVAGCRFAAPGNVPAGVGTEVPVDPNIVVESLAHHVLVIGDSPATPTTGGILLKSADGATILVNDSGIYIANGKGASITLVGPTVTVNDGALTVD